MEVLLVALIIALLACGPIALISQIILHGKVNRLERKLASSHSAIRRTPSAIHITESASHPLRPPIPREDRTPAPEPPLEPIRDPAELSDGLVSSEKAMGDDEDALRKIGLLPESPSVNLPAIEKPPPTPEKPATSLERIIGEKALNWAGVITVLCGLAFLLHAAFTRGWLGPEIMSGLVYAGGAILVGIGHRLRRKGYGAAAEGLSALGFGFLFLASFCARHVFDVMSNEAAFGVMAATAAAGAGLAGRYRSQILATLAFLGGFLTPLLLSTGENHGGFLLGYLIILSLGASIFTLRFDWAGLKLLALVGAWMVFGLWYREFGDVSRGVALAGASALFGIFSAAGQVAVLTGSRRRGRLDDVATAFVNALVSGGVLIHLLKDRDPEGLALILLGFCAWFGIQTGLFRQRKRMDDPLAATTTILAVTALTVAVPQGFGPWSSTVAWALEGVFLLYLGTRLLNAWILRGSITALILSVIGLMGLHPLHEGAFDPIFHRGFGAWMLVALSLAAAATWWRARLPVKKERPFSTSWCEILHLVHALAAGLLLVGAVGNELEAHLRLNVGYSMARIIPYLWLVLVVVGELYTPFARAFRLPNLYRLSFVFRLVGAIWFAFAIVDVHTGYLTPVVNPPFLCGLAVTISLFLPVASGTGRLDPRLRWGFAGAALGALLLLLSVEVWQYLYHHPDLSGDADRWALAALSALWAVYAAVLLVIGFMKDLPFLRYGALALLGVTLGKVFLFDTANLEAIYRILGFLTLGAMLILGSLLYGKK